MAVIGFMGRVGAQVKDGTAPESEQQAWDSMASMARANHEFGSVRPSADAAERKSALDKEIEHYIALAASARRFQEKYPESANALTAKYVEAENLLKAALLSKQSDDSAATKLAEEIRQDRRYPEHQRYAVMYLAEQVLVRNVAKNPADYRKAKMESARYLMEEFPAENGGYSLLLGAAEETRSVAELAAAAREVLRLPAPFSAKARASVLIERVELIGKSLADVANTALGRDNYFERTRGCRTVLYTWTSGDAASIELGKRLELAVPKGTRVVGVCLDWPRNVSGHELIAQAGLGGEQFFPEGGALSLLALMLKLDGPGVVYLTDRDGIITELYQPGWDPLPRAGGEK